MNIRKLIKALQKAEAEGVTEVYGVSDDGQEAYRLGGWDGNEFSVEYSVWLQSIQGLLPSVVTAKEANDLNLCSFGKHLKESSKVFAITVNMNT